MSINIGKIKGIILSARGIVSPPVPQANQFYVPSDNPFADHSEPVTAFWAAKNIEKIYFNGDENRGYDSFPIGSCVVIYWSGSDCSLCVATSEPDLTVRGLPSTAPYRINSTFTYENKTVYYRWLEDHVPFSLIQPVPDFNINPYSYIMQDRGRRAWLMIYGGYDT